jgi:hypothetical protein
MQDDFLIRESTEMLDDCSVHVFSQRFRRYLDIYNIFSHQEK